MSLGLNYPLVRIRSANLKSKKTNHFHKIRIRGAAIAQWIRLRTRFCHPGFESQAHHLYFYHLKPNLCYICHLKKTKINKKGPDLANLKIEIMASK